MSFNDSLSDMLARIKNAHQAKKVTTMCLKSKLNMNVLSVLKDEGYIRDFKNIEERKGVNSIKIDLKYYNTDSGGAQSVYFKFLDVGGSECNLRYISTGRSQNDSSAVPHAGSGGYFRPTFANQYATAATYQFYIYNSTLSDTSLDATITGLSSWYRESAGVSSANFAAQASADDKFAKFIINADAYSSGSAQNARVNARLYGVY